MDTKTIDRLHRPQRVRSSSGIADFAVDFTFDDQAPPGADEVALVFGILPDILGALLAARQAAEED